jgi:hypothetical protein
VLELPAVDGDRAKRERKGSIAELRSVPRTVTPITPVEIVRSDGRRELYDSLVFANVTRIAKYGRLSVFGRPDGGLFEVVSRRHGHRWRIAAMALRAATSGLGAQGPRQRRRIRDDQRCSLPDRRRSLHLFARGGSSSAVPRTPSPRSREPRRS